MSFAAAINCMDGRVQLPVNNYLKERFGVTYVDTITEPGPNGILAGGEESSQLRSILARLTISVEKHGASVAAVVGHHDCAGNPTEKAEQLRQIRKSISFLQGLFPLVRFIGLWVDEQWEVEELA